MLHGNCFKIASLAWLFDIPVMETPSTDTSFSISVSVTDSVWLWVSVPPVFFSLNAMAIQVMTTIRITPAMAMTL